MDVSDLRELRLSSARESWFDGERRLARARADGARAPVYDEVVRELTRQLRRRIGQTYTLGELGAAYERSADWCRDTAQQVAPRQAWAHDLAVVADPVFAAFARGASDWSAELAFARETALIGGAIALERSRRAPAARRKSDGSWVTEADEAVERELRMRIARAYPDHDILGEEGGHRSAAGGDPRDGAPLWVVDPIDGTHNYMAGIGIWATLVALRVDGQSVVGVAHAPALGETYDAALGHGSRLNDQPIAVDNVERLEDATVCFGTAGDVDKHGRRRLLDALVTRAYRDRGFGDFWGHMLVARGAVHVMIEPYPMPIWDIAALEPIVSEAGGCLTTLDGGPWQPGLPCLSTCRSLHSDVIALAAST